MTRPRRSSPRIDLSGIQTPGNTSTGVPMRRRNARARDPSRNRCALSNPYAALTAADSASRQTPRINVASYVRCIAQAKPPHARLQNSGMPSAARGGRRSNCTGRALSLAAKSAADAYGTRCPAANYHLVKSPPELARSAIGIDRVRSPVACLCEKRPANQRHFPKRAALGFQDNSPVGELLVVLCTRIFRHRLTSNHRGAAQTLVDGGAAAARICHRHRRLVMRNPRSDLTAMRLAAVTARLVAQTGASTAMALLSHTPLCGSPDAAGTRARPMGRCRVPLPMSARCGEQALWPRKRCSRQ